MFQYHTAFFAVVAPLFILGCAPPGYQNAVFTSVSWPASDQPLSIDQRVEIEGRLRALNYTTEPADGVISKQTRSAIRSFQADIGAPSNGHVSLPLLDALQTNSAFLTVDELRQANRGVPVRVPQRRTTGAAPTNTPTGAASDGGGGGSGGSGAGGWN